jgi:hypothetical protein
MSGRELVDRLERSHPEIRVLYASGYTDDAVVRHGVLEPGIAFIQKHATEFASNSPRSARRVSATGRHVLSTPRLPRRAAAIRDHCSAKS